MSFSQVMTLLLNDGNHILSASILMNSNGQMRKNAAEVYWSLLMKKHITEFEVMQMLYLPKSPFETTYMPNTVPAERPSLFGESDDEADATATEEEEAAAAASSSV